MNEKQVPFDFEQGLPYGEITPQLMEAHFAFAAERLQWLISLLPKMQSDEPMDFREWRDIFKQFTDFLRSFRPNSTLMEFYRLLVQKAIISIEHMLEDPDKEDPDKRKLVFHWFGIVQHQFDPALLNPAHELHRPLLEKLLAIARQRNGGVEDVLRLIMQNSKGQAKLALELAAAYRKEGKDAPK